MFKGRDKKVQSKISTLVCWCVLYWVSMTNSTTVLSNFPSSFGFQSLPHHLLVRRYSTTGTRQCVYSPSTLHHPPPETTARTVTSVSDRRSGWEGIRTCKLPQIPSRSPLCLWSKIECHIRGKDLYESCVTGCFSFYWTSVKEDEERKLRGHSPSLYESSSFLHNNSRTY